MKTEVEIRLDDLRNQWATETDLFKKKELEIEAFELKCYVTVGDKRCNKPVSFIGSFTCDDHKSKYRNSKKNRKWTVKEMQDRCLELAKEERMLKQQKLV